jgi:hypothetical protein
MRLGGQRRVSEHSAISAWERRNRRGQSPGPKDVHYTTLGVAKRRLLRFSLQPK